MLLGPEAYPGKREPTQFVEQLAQECEILMGGSEEFAIEGCDNTSGAFLHSLFYKIMAIISFTLEGPKKLARNYLSRISTDTH